MPQNPNQQRAADAVAAWLAKNRKNNRWLVDETGADPGTIGDFLNGERWPKIGTQGKIESALGWPSGIIRQIGNGADIPPSLLLDDPGPPEHRRPDWFHPDATEGLSVRAELDDDNNLVLSAVSTVAVADGVMSRLEVRYWPGPDHSAKNVDLMGVVSEAHSRALAVTEHDPALARQKAERIPWSREAQDAHDAAADDAQLAARRGRANLRGLKAQQDAAGEAPDPEGPEGGA